MNSVIAPPTLVGFDAAQDVTRILPQALAAGVAWIGRYLSFNDRKNLHRAEADAILAAVDRTWAPADESCVHPPARRVSVASMGAPERWLCGACGVEGTGGGT